MDAKLIVADWIANGLKKEGKDQKGLAEALDVSQPAISNLVNGIRSLKVEEIPAVVKYLDEPFPIGKLADGVYEVDGITGYLPILHRVAAGVWLEVDEAMDVHLGTIPITADPYYETHRQYAVMVVGDSMNLYIPDGGFVIVREADGEQPIHDDLVIVKRTQGGKIERTLKRYWVTRHGPELRPESSNPRHLPLPINGDEDTTIEIEGFVIGKYVPERRRRR